MAHVTFIHGMCNKPPAADLLRIWRQALAGSSEPLPLCDLGVTSSSVYWANPYDLLDPVCGFDANLAEDYRCDAVERVEDVAAENDGAWRHSATEYLRQPALRQALRRLLQL